MSKRSRLAVEGELTLATLQPVLDKISERLDKLDGLSGNQKQNATLEVVGAAGTIFRAGNMTLNRYGDDLEKGAVAFGARMDEAKQWIALQTIATIIEADTTQNIKYYYNTGLTPGVPFSPTLDLTVAL